MRHGSKILGMIIVSLAAAARLSAQSGAVAPKPALVKGSPDTTVRYIIPDRDKVKITLRGGSTYSAMLDGRELTLQVKPMVENLRDPAVGDASLPSEKVSRFTITVDDGGEYEFALIGVMPGRDVILMLTGPAPVKKK